MWGKKDHTCSTSLAQKQTERTASWTSRPRTRPPGRPLSLTAQTTLGTQLAERALPGDGTPPREAPQKRPERCPVAAVLLRDAQRGSSPRPAARRASRADRPARPLRPSPRLPWQPHAAGAAASSRTPRTNGRCGDGLRPTPPRRTAASTVRRPAALR